MTALQSVAFCDSYYRHIDCFNALGLCFDEDTAIVYTEGGMVWSAFATTFVALSLTSLIRLRR